MQAMTAIVNIIGSACAAGIFEIHARDARRAMDARATRRHRSKAHGVDSESRFLAIKKFSC